MKPWMIFVLGGLFALNLYGLEQDVAGRDATLAYYNSPGAWVDSRITAPLHVVMMVATAGLGLCGRPDRRERTYRPCTSA